MGINQPTLLVEDAPILAPAHQKKKTRLQSGDFRVIVERSCLGNFSFIKKKKTEVGVNC